MNDLIERVRAVSGGPGHFLEEVADALEAADERIAELEEEKPDAAEIIELRKAVGIYSENGKTYREKIKRLDAALREQPDKMLQSAQRIEISLLKNDKKQLQARIAELEADINKGLDFRYKLIKENKRLDAALAEIETEAIKPVVSADRILEIIEKARAGNAYQLKKGDGIDK